MRQLRAFIIAASLAAPSAIPGAQAAQPEFIPCSPASDFAEINDPPEVFMDGPRPRQIDFCAQWNPEWAYHGHRCCAKFVVSRKRSANRCAVQRRKASYCDEMTEEQRIYSEAASSGKLGDLLTLISAEVGRNGAQSYCHVNNGFLAYGRRIIPTAQNRILNRRPERCVDFGTDQMIGMLEWVGREVGKRYSEHPGVKFVVGDISAPRGGCLSGRAGRRGHVSHTSGVDVDLGFLTVKEGKSSPQNFHRDFDPKANWWLIKQIFKNPFACVKVIFLDRKHIRKLAKHASGDPDWEKYQRFVRHIKFHKDHLHVRIGHRPGRPGCVADPHPELETEEDIDLEGLAPGEDMNIEQSF